MNKMFAPPRCLARFIQNALVSVGIICGIANLLAADCNCAKPKIKVTANVVGVDNEGATPMFGGDPITRVALNSYAKEYEFERDKNPAYELSVTVADPYLVTCDAYVEFTFPHCTIEYRREGDSAWQKGTTCKINITQQEGVLTYDPTKIYLRITSEETNSISSEQLPGASVNSTPSPSGVTYDAATSSSNSYPPVVGHEIPLGQTQMGEGYRSLGLLVNYSGLLTPASWNLNSFYADGVTPLVSTYLAEDSGVVTEKHIITPEAVFRITGWDAVNEVISSYGNATATQIAVYHPADYNQGLNTFNAGGPHSYYRFTPTTQGGMDGQAVTQSNFGEITTATYLSNPYVLKTIKNGETQEITTVPPASGTTTWLRQNVITRDNVIVSHVTENYALNAINEYSLTSRSVDPNPNTSGDELVTFMQYDERGRIQAVSEPDGNWSFTEYDEFGGRKIYSPWLSEVSLTYANGFFSLPTQGSVRLTNSSETSSQTYLKDLSAAGNGVLTSSTTTFKSQSADYEVEQRMESTGQGGSVISYSSKFSYYHANELLRNKLALRWSSLGDATMYLYERGEWNGSAFNANASGPHYRFSEITGVISNPSSNSTLQDFVNVPSHSMKNVSIYTAVGMVKEEQWVCDSPNSFSPASAKTYEYETAEPYRVTGVKMGGRYVSKTEYVTPTLTRSYSQDGSVTEMVRDANGQVVSSTAVGSGNVPAVVTTYSRVGNVSTTSVNGVMQSVTAQDAAGRTISQQDSTGALTLISYANGGRTVTTTAPGGVTTIVNRHFDGRESSVTGTGVIPQYASYEIDSMSGFLTTTQRTGSVNSPRYVSQQSRLDGAVVKRITPNPDGGDPIELTYTYASSSNRLESVVSTAPNVAATVYAIADAGESPTYEAIMGHYRLEGRETDGTGPVIESTDRLTATETSYVNSGGQWYEQTLQKAYHTEGTSAHLLITQQSALSPTLVSHGTFGDGLRWTTLQIGPGYTITSHSDYFFTSAVTLTTVDDSRTTTSPDQSSQSLHGRVILSSQYGTAASASLTYDASGRVLTEKSPLGAVTRYFYNNGGQLEKRRDDLNRETSYEYYPANHLASGRVKITTNPESGTVENVYNERGDLTEVKGTATQRIVYEYNGYGERTGMRTWRSVGGAGDLTQWVYDAATGVLKEKIDAANKKTSYVYDAAGRVYQRSNARNMTTTYGYNEYGENTTITYPAGTANVTRTFDRLGREKTINDASGLRTMTYHAQNGLTDLIAYNNTGALANRQIDYTFDGALRPSGYAATGLSAVSYGYDTLGRFSMVTSGNQSHTYSYLAGTGVQYQRGTTVSGTPRLTETRIIDRMGRLQNIRTTNAAGAVQSMHGYEFDVLDRRSEAVREDGRRWQYGYNARGEVTSAAKFTADGASALPAHRYTYAYDDMGNLVNTTRSVGVDAAPVMQTSYGSNALNQYTSITTPGQYPLLAEVPPTVGANEVTFNGQFGARLENMLFTNIAVSNATTGVLATSTVVRSGSTPETITGKNWVPKNVVAPSHDFDGNLTNDGLWTYTWDAENRLTSMMMNGNAGYATRVKLDFLYDSQHRRVSKAVSTTTSQLVNPTWTLQGTTRFLYDDWNMIAQYSFAANVFTAQAQYVWGLDVNGAMQGAGGVGGLLHAVLIDSANAPCLPCYDGNGNIAAWVHGGNGSLIERREYDSFGNMIMVFRLAADASLHAKLFYGFSTKWRDPESELLYFGHRYYNPNTQRWLNRDPIEEAGGINLYGFVGNDGVNQWDLLGMQIGGDPTMSSAYLNGGMRHSTPKAVEAKNTAEGTYEHSGKEMGADGMFKSALAAIGGSAETSYSSVLAVIPGGTIEFKVGLQGRVCHCKAKDGSIGFKFKGEASLELNGGIGFVVGTDKYVPKSVQNGKYILLIDKATGKPKKGTDGRNTTGVGGGGVTAEVLLMDGQCENEVNLTPVSISIVGIAGVGFWGGTFEQVFGKVSTKETKWGFDKPQIKASWGAGQPVGLRAQIALKTSLAVTLATKD